MRYVNSVRRTPVCFACTDLWGRSSHSSGACALGYRYYVVKSLRHYDVFQTTFPTVALEDTLRRLYILYRYIDFYFLSRRDYVQAQSTHARRSTQDRQSNFRRSVLSLWIHLQCMSFCAHFLITSCWGLHTGAKYIQHNCSFHFAVSGQVLLDAVLKFLFGTFINYCFSLIISKYRCRIRCQEIIMTVKRGEPRYQRNQKIGAKRGSIFEGKLDRWVFDFTETRWRTPNRHLPV